VCRINQLRYDRNGGSSANHVIFEVEQFFGEAIFFVKSQHGRGKEGINQNFQRPKVSEVFQTSNFAFLMAMFMHLEETLLKKL